MELDYAHHYHTKYKETPNTTKTHRRQAKTVMSYIMNAVQRKTGSLLFLEKTLHSSVSTL